MGRGGSRLLAGRAALYAALAMLPLAGPDIAPAAEAAAPAPPLILSRDAYWRCRYRYGGEYLDPTLLSSEGRKYTGPRYLKSLLARQKKGHPFRAADAPHWSLWDNGPPPADWARPDFDDSTWPRCRKPDYLGSQGPIGPIVRTVCFRGRFLVPDPATCGELTVRVVYRGGARVLLNGTEVARGHLPQGRLDPDVRAEGYPLDAYIVLDDEFTADFPKRRITLWPRVWSPTNFDRWRPGPGPADKKAGRKIVHRTLCPGITRHTVERLLRRRDRVIGPLALPRRLLRKGANVLAIENRAAYYHPAILACGIQNGTPRLRPWPHVMVKSVELRTATDKIPSPLARPAGVQVWVEDMHARVYSTEYLEPGAPTGAVRIAAARNGTYSAQIVVGADRALGGLRATPGELKRAGGGTIPAAAWSTFVMGSHPVAELMTMGMDDYDHKPRYQFRYAVQRHGPKGVRKWDPRRKEFASLRFFDRLSRSPPGVVPANTCQPVWLSLKVPADAGPGRYRGVVTVAAQGMKPVDVPVHVDVIDWRVPDPQQFVTVVAAEQSPYGLAERYRVPLWSDRHFALMEASFRHLARLGNDWLFVPVISSTEFGNRKDSPIKWIRKRDGRLGFDYSVLDRYLGLAVKHWGKPLVASFVIAHGNPVAESEVEIVHEATGKSETFNLGVDHMEDRPLVDAAHRKVWKAFAESLWAHMKAKGLETSMFWGYTWDAPANRDLVKFLRTVTPNVYWSRGSHYAGINKDYRAACQVYGFRGNAGMNGQGWRRKELWLQNSRRAWFGSFVGCSGVDTPFLFRYWPEQTLTFGQRGLGRIGVDYWGIWRKGCEVLNMKKARGRTKGTVGYAINNVLWPGEKGPEGSARLDALIEGIQETEARIFLEQALARGGLPAELTGRIRARLRRRSQATARILSSTSGHQHDYCWQGWRERSGALYRLAADVAKTPAAPAGAK